MTEKKETPPKTGSKKEEIDAKFRGRYAHKEFPDLLINYYAFMLGDKMQFKGLPPQELIDKIEEKVGNWPKRVGEALHIVDEGILRMVGSPRRFFGYLQMMGFEVDWRSGGSMTDKETFYEFMKLVSDNYEAIQTLPHFPEMKGVYYAIAPIPVQAVGKYLDTLLDFFNPATEEDRACLRSLFLTVFWGGPGGARPTFVLLGPEDDEQGGRGVGKTTITEVLAMLTKPYIDFGERATRDDMCKRLLTAPDARLVTIDNVKEKLSSGDLESLVTRQYINGHLLYVGNHTIPNLFTYIVTDNQPHFSKDMSQRSVTIRLARPKEDPNWWRNVAAFVEKNKQNIHADIINELRSAPKVNFTVHTRYPLWSEEVLSKCTVNAALTEIIKHKQSDTDEETHAIDDILEVIDSHMSEYAFMGGMGDGLPYDRSKARYRVSQSLVLQWIEAALQIHRRKALSLLALSKPDWLILPYYGATRATTGRRKLGVTIKGYPMLDFGHPSVSVCWVVLTDSKYNQRVYKTMPVTVLGRVTE